MYLDQSASEQTKARPTEACHVEKGCKQGCIHSSSLFNLYSSWLIRKAIEAVNKGIKVKN